MIRHADSLRMSIPFSIVAVYYLALSLKKMSAPPKLCFRKSASRRLRDSFDAAALNKLPFVHTTCYSRPGKERNNRLPVLRCS